MISEEQLLNLSDFITIYDYGKQKRVPVSTFAYEILNLKFGTSKQEWKWAYIKLTASIKESDCYHFKAVCLAYDSLVNPSKYEEIGNGKRKIKEQNSLYYHILVGNVEKAIEYINNHPNIIDEKDELERGFLYLAAANNQYEICKHLLKKGANINDTQIDGSTPLHGASFYGRENIVKLLLSYGADKNIINRFKNKPANEANTSSIRKIIVDYEPGTKMKNIDDEVEEYTDYFYVNNGNNKFPIATNPYKVLELTTNSDKQEWKRAYIKKTYGVNHQSFIFRTVCLAFDSLVNPNEYEEIDNGKRRIKNRDSFYYYIISGYKEKAINFINNNSNVIYEKDGLKRGFLYLAAVNGQIEICERLLIKGANVNDIQVDGSTPLHGASFYGRENIVKLLLSYGADKNIINRFKNKPVNEANTSSIREIIENFDESSPLIQYDSTIDEYTDFIYDEYDEYNTLIPIATNPYKVLELEANTEKQQWKIAYINKTDGLKSDNYKYKIYCLAYDSLVNPAKYNEIENGKRKIKDQRSVYFYTIVGSKWQVINEIENNRNLINVKDELKRGLLYLAAANGQYGICEHLLKLGANIHDVQIDESTPLHGAAFYGRENIVKLLLSYGADTKIKNRFGNIPLDEGYTKSIENIIKEYDIDKIGNLYNDLIKKNLASKFIRIEAFDTTQSKKRLIAKKIICSSNILPSNINELRKDWVIGWHGTKFEFLESILKYGLRPSGDTLENGKKISPLKGHFDEDLTFEGIKNWGKAIFTSPSIFYSAAYAGRIMSEGENWAILVETRVRPGTFTQHKSTLSKYYPLSEEPTNVEYRVGCDPTKELINRVTYYDKDKNVYVLSITFVLDKFLDGIEDYDKGSLYVNSWEEKELFGM